MTTYAPACLPPARRERAGLPAGLRRPGEGAGSAVRVALVHRDARPALAVRAALQHAERRPAARVPARPTRHPQGGALDQHRRDERHHTGHRVRDRYRQGQGGR